MTKKESNRRYYLKVKDRMRRIYNTRSRVSDRKKRGSTNESLRKSKIWRGRRVEVLVANLLAGAVDVNKEALTKLPYDLLLCDLTVNVKSSSLVKNHGMKVLHFGHKGIGDADYYLCVGLDADNIPMKYYMIPGGDYKQDGALINPWGKSKYRQYEVELDQLPKKLMEIRR